MISNKALKAACEAYAKSDICEADPMRAALSAALPLLLEGKREEIAREVDPHAWASYDDIVREGWSKVDPDGVREKWVGSSLARADRIIAMLGGGDVG